mmetsp:Transcript_7554/g.14361  ORF Transcript_7554/g.14361 Transcript_7554/m.14361 type:complete len:304 (-) Transcript_7554:99-1010(-)
MRRLRDCGAGAGPTGCSGLGCLAGDHDLLDLLEREQRDAEQRSHDAHSRDGPGVQRHEALVPKHGLEAVEHCPVALLPTGDLHPRLDHISRRVEACSAPSRQAPSGQQRHLRVGAISICKEVLQVGVRREEQQRERDIPDESGFGALVHATETQALDDVHGPHALIGGQHGLHLQTNLRDLHGVCGDALNKACPSPGQHLVVQRQRAFVLPELLSQVLIGGEFDGLLWGHTHQVGAQPLVEATNALRAHDGLDHVGRPRELAGLEPCLDHVQREDTTGANDAGNGTRPQLVTERQLEWLLLLR